MSSTAFDKAEQIAKAVLYEGYMLYPYRASSTKNRQRATFGTLYPEHHPDVLNGSEKCRNQLQCLVRGDASSVVASCVRFLQMRSRVIEARDSGMNNHFHWVESLLIGTEINQSLDEAVERAVEAEVEVGEILHRPRMIAFEFAPSLSSSDLRDANGNLLGRIRKAQLAISGNIRLSAETTEQARVFRITIELMNTTSYVSGSDVSSALLTSFASAHTIVSVREGEFISLLDPPQDLRDAAAACKNIGLYPVLVGDPGERDLMLASPIILYDYPQVAPESAGDFFDSTEMDEMLTLRVMTLTEEEKSEMRNSDDRVRELLARTEATAREQLRRTHGIIRDLRPAKDDAA